MSSGPGRGGRQSPADIQIVPIGRRHVAGFHVAVDSVARERRYLAMLQAPTFARTRRFVFDSLKGGAVHVVAVARGRGRRLVRPAAEDGPNPAPQRRTWHGCRRGIPRPRDRQPHARRTLELARTVASSGPN